MKRGHGAIALAALALGAGVPAVAAAATAADAGPALVTGRSRDGRVSFRLEGRRLTVRFTGGGLSLPGARSRFAAVVSCGEWADEGRPPEAYEYRFFAVRVTRHVRVTRGVRALRVQFGRDVARWVNHCRLSWWDRDRASARAARMTLRRGAAPGCVPADPRSIVAASAEVVVTAVWWDDGSTGSGTLHRACLTSSAVQRPLASAIGNQYYGSSNGLFVVAGTWVAWFHAAGELYGSSPPVASVGRVDVGAGGPIESVLLQQPVPETGAWAAAAALAVGPGGTAAWVERTRGGQLPPDRLVVWPSDGTSAVLAAAPSGTLTDPAFSADGRTLTWREGGQPRSAPMP